MVQTSGKTLLLVICKKVKTCLSLNTINWQFSLIKLICWTIIESITLHYHSEELKSVTPFKKYC